MTRKKRPPHGKIKVWDIGTRLFHWALVILFSLSAYSAFQDKFGIYATMHLWSGFGVLCLVSWRIIWGFIGSDTARFSRFLKGPKATLLYAKTALKKTPYHHVGHNPLGALSVVAMLVLLLVQASFGLFSNDDIIFSGPLADSISDRLSGDITGWHEVIGFTLFGIIGLHVFVIIYMAVRRRVNLVMPMISGYLKANSTPDKGAQLPHFRSPLLALAAALVVGGALYWYIF
jgi:cytochrome b